MFNFKNVKVGSVDLDLTNPRIARIMDIYPNPTSEQIALALGSHSTEEESNTGPSYNTLVQSIKTNGGIIHPIIVNEKPDGTMIVIEGNTRVLIYKEFSDNQYSGNWDIIPAMVYDDMSIEQIDAIRLQAHLVGTRAWDPYSKAKYLENLWNKQHLTTEQIVDYCGGDKREVTNYIAAYEDMEEFYRNIVDEGEFDPTRFSAFVELQQSRVKDALVHTGFSKADFAKWVHEKKLFPLSTVRALPRILRNQQSKDTFIRSGAKDALKVLDSIGQNPSLDDVTLSELIRSIIKKIAHLKYSYVQDLRNDEENEEKELLMEAKDAIVGLCGDIEPN
ncbi:MAG: hypothetical protein CMI58_05715 [Parcubacteria group bacterium]|jgi:ParB-like chromosome segregation protein Spo0J|nr:hypothetical protein [Parcubacteria group bacterium]|tara:strand:- start:4079 stop:5077 length:999 start_codon:yes stop_codon:yes gene_type:complete